MNIHQLRLALFGALMRPFSRRSRNKRMRTYVSLMGIREGMSVLDLGGQPGIWDSVEWILDITILNLPGIAESTSESRHRIRYVEGDACCVEEFESGQFDTVFSNSVIEHVGPEARQVEFGHEVRRLGRSYWVQTPAKSFPIEAHCGMPFWWFYPAWARRYLVERWRRRLPAWSQMVEETRVLSKRDMQRLFPEATILVETYLGIPKSYIAYCRKIASDQASSRAIRLSRS
jgi:hypothetical protein